MAFGRLLVAQVSATGNPSTVTRRLREYSRLIDQTTESWWQVQLKDLRRFLPDKLPAPKGKVHFLQRESVPHDVQRVLSLGPKFAVEKRRTPPELLSLVRQVSQRAAGEDAVRCVSDGVDALIHIKYNQGMDDEGNGMQQDNNEESQESTAAGEWITAASKAQRRRGRRKLNLTSGPPPPSSPLERQPRLTMRKPAPRPAPLPLDDYKLVMRSRSGLDVAKLAPSELSLALLQATNTTWRQANLRLRIDQNQNTATVSTPTKEMAIKFIEVSKIKDSTTVILTFAGLVVPHYLWLYGAEYRCTLHKKTVPVCWVCYEVGHRSTACPRPGTRACHECGTRDPAPGHTCVAKCTLCGGGHITGTKGCPERFITPYLIRQRERQKQHEQQALSTHLSKRDQTLSSGAGRSATPGGGVISTSRSTTRDQSSTMKKRSRSRGRTPTPARNNANNANKQSLQEAEEEPMWARPLQEVSNSVAQLTCQMAQLAAQVEQVCSEMAKTIAKGSKLEANVNELMLEKKSRKNAPYTKPGTEVHRSGSSLDLTKDGAAN
ncbi:hypothetical protein HPB49_013851 [Dermacentor silvarum]|uniref:Uncharacterized protein n=1 Tax=Dermacentor silvarum TaxID=543639 RepID=A0ACB8CXN4_DERSI|nr:hypothetical protein HPB49_013851 [Dermacentor silvarum]